MKEGRPSTDKFKREMWTPDKKNEQESKSNPPARMIDIPEVQRASGMSEEAIAASAEKRRLVRKAQDAKLALARAEAEVAALDKKPVAPPEVQSTRPRDAYNDVKFLSREEINKAKAIADQQNDEKE